MHNVEQARFERIEALFHRASELLPAAQGPFLAQACDGDEVARGEVEALLAATPQALDQLDALTQGAAPALGQQVGAYRLESKIGEGGSSVVYRARRTDQRYEKAVAIKIRKAGHAGWSGPDRFAAECRILARLEHPAIARLYDAGSLPSGEPYVVMELVPGERITDYCDRLRLSIPRRLELFRRVCAAVDYAHRRLIVHRDLKPSNILVAGDQPMLLDFGIAKLLEPTDPDQVDATVTALQPMTPQYASPEQILGEPVGIASDVYALGMLLYELLTGVLPYRFTGRNLGELDQMLARLEQLSPASSAVARGDGVEQRAQARRRSAPSLRSLMAGDLDAIVGKALRRESESRYATAAALVADLERYRDGHPVRARAGTLGYRSRRFVRRHRWGLASTAVVLTLLVGLAAAVARQSVLVGQERDRARTVSEFVTDLFEVYNEASTKQAPTVKAMLDQGVRQIDADPRLSNDERATMLDTLGGLYRRVGAVETGLPLIERALELRHDQFGDRHVDTVASVLNLARSHDYIGDLEAARAGYDLVLARQRQILGPQHPDVAETLRLLGNLHHRASDYPLAENNLREALAIWQDLLAAGNERAIPDHAEGLGDLASLLTFLGRFEEAGSLLKSALAIKQTWFGLDHPTLVWTLFDLAELSYGQGRFEDAEREYRQALDLARRFRSADHRIHQRGLNGLGMTLDRLGKLPGAEMVLRECLKLVGQNVGKDHPDYASTQTNLAGVLSKRGQVAEAERLYRAAYAIRLEALGDRHAAVQHSRYSLGLVLLRRGDGRGALDMLDLGESGLDAANLPRQHFSRAYFKVARGRALLELDRAQEAESVLRAALGLARAALPAGHWRIAAAESALGGALVALGRDDEGRALLVGSLAPLVAVEGPNSWTVSWAKRWLSVIEPMPVAETGRNG